MAQHDVVVFGATSFVGQLVCRHLFQRFGAVHGLRWAMAGRSRGKLESVRDGLGEAAAGIPLIVADAADEAALGRMCDTTRVVVSTVGPYALYGSPLVKVCAERGTDYCDLTGEVQWIARMIQQHEAAAKRSGARILHCAGFDSVPSDVGVHVLQREAMARFGAPAKRVKLRVKAARGGFSGGTVASLLNVVQEARRDPDVRGVLTNPYALCPAGANKGPRQPNVQFAEYDADARSWLAPFVMAGINTRVVHRSHALLGRPWGEDFLYDEAMMTGDGLRGRATAMGVGGGLGGFMVAAALPPARWALERFVLPKPGEGPSPKQQQEGFYDMRLFGETEAGDKLVVKVTGKGDPGYGSTSQILGEIAALMAESLADDKPKGGFTTPSVLLGDPLVERLQSHAGMGFSVISPKD